MTEPKFKFDQAMKELEEITAWFESGEVDLDQGLVKFERGMELANKLKEHLAQVENRVEKIKVKFSDTTRPAAELPPEPTDDELGLFE